MKNITLKNKTKNSLSFRTVAYYSAIGLGLFSIIFISVMLIFNIGIQNITKAEKGSADEFLSILDGDWDDSDIWSSSKAVTVPGNDDNTTVEDIVHYSGDLNLKNSLSISENGELELVYLEIKNGATLNVEGVLKIESLEFDNGSFINVGADAIIIVNGGFMNRNNSDNVSIHGSVTVKGDFYNGNGGIIDGTGSIKVDGSYLGNGTTFGVAPNSSIPPGSTVPSTLPIELIDYNVEKRNNAVKIEWTTSSELNNDYFTVERSSDGINYTTIAHHIAGAGTSNMMNKYSIIDENPKDGLNYYRLIQTDFDGKTEEFQAKAISFSDNNNENNIEMLITKVYPNPFSTNFTVEYLTSSNQPLQIMVLNLNGIKLIEESIIPKIGYNSFNFNNVSQLKQGHYLLFIMQGNQKSGFAKIVKK